MEVANPRRVLAISLEEEAHHLSKVIKEITGANLVPASTTLAGTSHDLPLKTPYYNATVPIWLDLIATPSEWSESFLTEEAREVLAVLGGLVLVFALPSATSTASGERTRELVKHVGQVVKKGLGGWEWDGVGLAVAVGEGATEEWDEACAEAGLEFVQVTGKAQTGRNEFGEKSGIPRVKEALESNDWAQLDDDGPLSDFGDFEDPSTQDKDDDPENMDFGYDKADFEGLKKAIWENSLLNDDGDFDASTGKKGAASTDKEKDGAGGPSEDSGMAEVDVDDVIRVERMMAKLQAVREAGEGMGEEQRKKMAARAVREVMADLDS
ncbi:hypothetical protein CC79DRAFT_1368792 [Sarocladium strictum]